MNVHLSVLPALSCLTVMSWVLLHGLHWRLQTCVVTRTLSQLRKDWPRPRLMRVQPRKIDFLPKTFSESEQKRRKRGAWCAGTSKEGFRSWGAVTTTPYASLRHVEVGLFWRPALRTTSFRAFLEFSPNSLLMGARHRGSPAGHQKLVSSNR